MSDWLQGLFTPLVTPFRGDRIDVDAYERLVSWQIDQGADGLVICSAAGEGSALTQDEKIGLLVAARRVAGGAYPLLAAIGSYSTRATLEEVAAAQRAGATALLLRMPYYSRPTQAGLAAHIRAVASATAIEIVRHNDPDRCGVEIAVETLEVLRDTPNAIGILEQRGDIRRCQAIVQARDRRFLQLTGAADTIPAYLLAGGCGAAVGVGNLAPHWLKRILATAHQADFAQAQLLQQQLLPLISALDAEPEPVLLKHALSHIHAGFDPGFRLPLTGADIEIRRRVDVELAGLSSAPHQAKSASRLRSA